MPKRTKTRQYVDPQGISYPLYEATTPLTFRWRRADLKRSVKQHPYACPAAWGVRHLPNVKLAYIGHGKDAYVVFAKGPRSKKAHALHYTIPAKTRRAAAQFDIGEEPPEQDLTLNPPTAGRTLSHRRKLNARRRKAIAAGARKRRHKARKPNVRPHRPAAHVTNGTVIAA